MVATLILLTDIYEMKQRKEEELTFYLAEREKLQAKMDMIRREIDLTNQIIEIIEKEKVVDLVKLARNKSTD
jgi:DNA-binding XRE family transcriptional regulator